MGSRCNALNCAAAGEQDQHHKHEHNDHVLFQYDDHIDHGPHEYNEHVHMQHNKHH